MLRMMPDQDHVVAWTMSWLAAGRSARDDHQEPLFQRDPAGPRGEGNSATPPEQSIDAFVVRPLQRDLVHLRVIAHAEMLPRN